MKNILLCLSFVATSSLVAQDVHFSQMSHSPLSLNPALAGANFDLQANVNYRTQWNSVADPYNTIAASVDARLNTHKRKRKSNLGVGVNFFNDNAGGNRLSTNKVNLNLASHVIIRRNQSLGLGLYGGILQRSLNSASGKWGSQYNGMVYDETSPSGENFSSSNFINFDAGAGLVYTLNSAQQFIVANKTTQVNVGLAAYHVNRPSYSFINRADEKLYMRFSAFFNGSFGVKNSKSKFEPGIYYNMQGNAQEILYGAYGRFMLNNQSFVTGYYRQSSIAFGLFCRNQDALIAKANFEWNGMSLGLAYDFNLLSSLSSLSRARGGIEFFLRYTINDFHAQYIK